MGPAQTTKRVTSSATPRPGSVALATTLIFVALSSACSSAALVQRGPHGGRFVLRGPYMPAMAQARAQMLEHCNRRFVVHEGRDSRDGSYLCEVIAGWHGDEQ